MATDVPKINVDNVDEEQVDAPKTPEVVKTHGRSKSPTSKASILAATLNYRITIQFTRVSLLEETVSDTEDLTKGATPEYEDVIGRHSVLEALWAQFTAEHQSLASNCTPNFLTSDYVRDAVFEKAYRLYARSKSMLASLEQRLIPLPTHAHSSSSTRTRPHYKLPEIKLPTFEGNYASWLSFRDLSTSMVIDNDEIQPVEKIHYLKTSLSDRVSQLVANVPVSGDHFPAAWSTLSSRYENRRLLVSAQLDKLLQVHLASARSSKQLNELINNVNEALNTLTVLGSPVHQWDKLLVHLLTQRLDPVTREAWEVKLGSSSKMPSLEQLLAFITGRARARERLELDSALSTHSSGSASSSQRHSSRTHSVTTDAAHSMNTHPTQHSSEAHPTQSSARTQSHSSRTQPTRSTQPRRSGYMAQYPCDLCGGDHYLVRCRALFLMTQTKRAETARLKKLCPNCLGHHMLDACRSQHRCEECNEPHHSMLHNPAIHAKKSTQ